VEWCQRAAVQGDRDAQLNLGAFYINGSGVALKQRKAFEWFEKAAIQGLAMAQFNLGMCFTCGIGIAKDYFQAFEWFQKAAMQGIRPLNIVLATIISTE
jgi:TPR repeat protein